ncbi:glycosyltransferase family 87 protein [Hymenobacter busanensis]|uniref:glycosyltransferase family 87 protein n=1 Tax=Hymenobacter busanensis TaxID=2607656 RepID=UPI001366FE37|nr:glycosyltransferase family 87 protein [Hymenobacter busanensis]QHJ07607.1 DUF2029 domain-containing protein [Hymenobacter busanensis]
MFRSRFSSVVVQPRFVLVLYSVLLLVATAQQYLKHTIDNYKIFTVPFWHLLAGRDLYADYPTLYSVPYKYSPTFALFMGWAAAMPDWLGLLLWNALNLAVCYPALRRLFPDQRRGLVLLLLLAIDTLTALQNSQSNNLLLGLMLWTYINLESGKYRWAGLCIALAFFIKVYGIGIGLIFLFYPGWWRAALWAVAFGILLALAPLLVASWPEFVRMYEGWYTIVRVSATGVQLSVMGVLETWFGWPIPKGVVQGLGLATLLLPLLHWRSWAEVHYRRLYVAAILIFVVIFNQMAESPTFVIAVAGFGLWFLAYHRSVPGLAWGLLGLVLVFTSLSPSDLFPAAVRNGVFVPYKIKAVPMILAWLLIMVQLLWYPRWCARLAQADAESARHTPELAA